MPRFFSRRSASLHFGFALSVLAVASSTLGAAELLQDFVDPDYGSHIRQLRRDEGHEHNLYYHRDPWNADGTRMLVVRSNLQQRNWQVMLHDGDGGLLKELFPIDRYDWRVVWDRRDPTLLYTWRGSNLYRCNVTSGDVTRLKSFAPLSLKPNGPSLNQAGDRILVITSDNVFRSFRLPDMNDERTFTVPLSEGETVSWDKPAYIGCQGRIHVAVRSALPEKSALLVYDDTGVLVHRFNGIGGGGHYDFSPEGKLAYFRMPWMSRPGGGTDLEIHVVDADGANDRIVYRTTREASAYLHNLHLSWPDRVNDWFVAALFPRAGRLPPRYAPPLDEIIQIKLDGTTRLLARSGTTYSVAGEKGSTSDMFWAQPLASPSADGRRILFNSNRSGTIDACILYTSQQDSPAATRAR